MTQDQVIYEPVRGDLCDSLALGMGLYAVCGRAGEVLRKGGRRVSAWRGRTAVRLWLRMVRLCAIIYALYWQNVRGGVANGKTASSDGESEGAATEDSV